MAYLRHVLATDTMNVMLEKNSAKPALQRSEKLLQVLCDIASWRSSHFHLAADLGLQTRVLQGVPRVVMKHMDM